MVDAYLEKVGRVMAVFYRGYTNVCTSLQAPWIVAAPNAAAIWTSENKEQGHSSVYASFNSSDGLSHVHIFRR